MGGAFREEKGSRWGGNIVGDGYSHGGGSHPDCGDGLTITIPGQPRGHWTHMPGPLIGVIALFGVFSYSNTDANFNEVKSSMQIVIL